MRVIKGLLTSLLGFLLFVVLSIFGRIFTVDQTMLNPGFISSVVDEVNVTAIAEETMAEQQYEEGLPEEVQTALFDTTVAIELTIK